MQIAVTGASGFLGSHLCQRLLQEGHRVRAVVRDPTGGPLLVGVPVEIHRADVGDTEALTRAFQGCEAVFHTAGKFSMWAEERPQVLAVNLEGTRNALAAARSAGVRRFLFTSSTSALGIPPEGTIGDEATAYNWERFQLPYMDSKHQAELEVLRAAENGLEAIILNPATIMGPGDIHFTGGRWLRNMSRGRIPGYTDGGMNFVAVADVVEGHVAALERGRPGERYILGGENLDYQALFTLLAEICGRRPPTQRVPYWAFRAFARMQVLWASLGGPAPEFTPQSVPIAYLSLYYSSAKANRELGYEPGPARPAFESAYQWYRDRNLL